MEPIAETKDGYYIVKVGKYEYDRLVRGSRINIDFEPIQNLSSIIRDSDLSTFWKLELLHFEYRYRDMIDRREMGILYELIADYLINGFNGYANWKREPGQLGYLIFDLIMVRNAGNKKLKELRDWIEATFING